MDPENGLQCQDSGSFQLFHCLQFGVIICHKTHNRKMRLLDGIQRKNISLRKVWDMRFT